MCIPQQPTCFYGAKTLTMFRSVDTDFQFKPFLKGRQSFHVPEVLISPAPPSSSPPLLLIQEMNLPNTLHTYRVQILTGPSRSYLYTYKTFSFTIICTPTEGRGYFAGGKWLRMEREKKKTGDKFTIGDKLPGGVN